ncbi:MAG: tetratricopeptide repeat protein [Planctomycetota bacterium]
MSTASTTHPRPRNPAHLSDATAVPESPDQAAAQHITRDPLDPVPAHHLLGRALLTLRQPQQALPHLAEAARLDPARPEPALDAVAPLAATGNRPQALDLATRTARQHPKHAPAQMIAGEQALAAKRLPDAAAFFNAAATLAPNDRRLQFRAAQALYQCGALADAAARADRLTQTHPNDADAHDLAGSIHLAASHYDPAVHHHTRAADLQPSARRLQRLGDTLAQSHRYAQALPPLRQAIALDPNHAPAHHALGSVLGALGHVHESIAAYRQALALQPQSVASLVNIALALNYVSTDGQAILQQARAVGQRAAQAANTAQASPLNRAAPSNDPDRPLRVGYVSRDFSYHPVGQFAKALFLHHDRNHFQVFAYHTPGKVDAQTQWFIDHSQTYRRFPNGTDPRALAQQIADDRIDILIDLAGLTTAWPLVAFAHRPAPVQITFLGYPATTGVDALQFRLTDAVCDPPGTTEAFHFEQLIRLDPGFLCYAPWDGTEDLPTAASTDRAFTFGCFTNLAKLQNDALDLWAAALHAVPDSRLLIKSRAIDAEGATDRIVDRLTAAGIDRSRLTFAPGDRSTATHLARYADIDIALDTTPYHGTTTTCDALWMGVPVVTRTTALHAGRVSASILTQLDLPDLIADTPDAFATIAAQLAADAPRRQHLRTTLRQRMLDSPLMDGPAYAQRIEAAYRQLWRDHCATSSA